MVPNTMGGINHQSIFAISTLISCRSKNYSVARRFFFRGEWKTDRAIVDAMRKYNTFQQSVTNLVTAGW